MLDSKLGIDHISAISLFVENLQATRSFYLAVFGAPIIYEDDNSVAMRFQNVIINLLRVENAPEIIEPGVVATADCGSRFQLSVWIDDVDRACVELQARGVALLTGPRDRPWGVRTATFVDPAGHSWEIGQRTRNGT